MTEWVMIGLTAVYVIATIFICVFNHKSARASKEQLEEMRRQYAEENRPYITAEITFERHAWYVLRFANHGKNVARRVRIQFDENFLTSVANTPTCSVFETQKGRERIIGIGQHYDLPFGYYDFCCNPNKIPISGLIKYSDGKKIYSENFFFDLDTYAPFFSVNSEADDFLKEMKGQKEEIKKIREIFSCVIKNR